MKHQCTLSWLDVIRPMTRDEAAKKLRLIRQKGYVLRLRPGEYRGVVNGAAYVAVIDTRCKK